MQVFTLQHHDVKIITKSTVYTKVIQFLKMPNLTLMKKVNCTPVHAFAIVSDVASYPLFVPSCVSTKLLGADQMSSVFINNLFIHSKPSTILAEMSVQFGPIYETYTSKIQFDPIQSIKITAQNSQRSIFSHLDTHWKFSPVSGDEEACNIEFRLNFQFCSSFYNAFSTLFMHQLSVHTMQAFEDRILGLYKRQQRASSNCHK